MSRQPDTRNEALQRSLENPLDSLARVISIWALIWGAGLLTAGAIDAALKATRLVLFLPARWTIAVLLGLLVAILIVRFASIQIKELAYRFRHLIIFALGCLAGVFWMNGG